MIYPGNKNQFVSNSTPPANVSNFQSNQSSEQKSAEKVPKNNVLQTPVQTEHVVRSLNLGSLESNDDFLRNNPDKKIIEVQGKKLILTKIEGGIPIYRYV